MPRALVVDATIRVDLAALGSGAAGANSLSNGPIFRDNTGGHFWNAIFTDFKGYAARIETESAQAQDSARPARPAARS